MNKATRVAVEIGVPTALLSSLSIFPIQQGLMPWWMFGVIFVEASCLQILFRNIYPQVVGFQRSLGSGDSSFIALLSTLVVGILVMIPLLMSEKGILVPTPELTWWSYVGGSILLAVWTTWSLRDIKTKKIRILGHWDPSRYLRAVQMEEFAGGELLLVPRDGLEVIAWEVETFHSVSLEYSWFVVFYKDDFVQKPALRVWMTIRTESLRPGMLFLKEKEILRRGEEVFWEKRDSGLLERIHQGACVDEISTFSLPLVLKKDEAEIPVRWSVEAIY